MLFDTHAHYDDEYFDNDRDAVLAEAYDKGVKYILSASSDIESCRKNISLSQKFDFVYASVGIHPHNVAGLRDDVIAELRGLAECRRVVAVGEIGLDYYYDNAPREEQKSWFAKQLSFAAEIKKPVIIHDRDAHKDTLDIVKAENARDIGGVFHCFSGSVEMAKEVLNNNFYISVGGVVTFKNARRTREVVEYVPMDRLLLETDSPYLTPEPWRGKRNDSRYLYLIAEKVAEIKGRPVEEIEEITTENAKNLFNII